MADLNSETVRPRPLVGRVHLAEMIAKRLSEDAARLRKEFSTPGRIPSAVIEDLLPQEVARAIYAQFPAPERMVLKRSIKEHKRVAAQMNAYDPLLEEAVYAFQEPAVVELIAQITGLRALEPDADLYAGGISLMTKGGYLRPHLDNSHDADQRRYRVLNLLYYVTPDWDEADGGSLQLWDHGPQTMTRTIASRFNRLVLMATNRTSWHSVCEIVGDDKRCCVSNYYFSSIAPATKDYFHCTSFRDEKPSVGDLVMQADNAIRTTILKTLPRAYKNPHVYKK